MNFKGFGKFKYLFLLQRGLNSFLLYVESYAAFYILKNLNCVLGLLFLLQRGEDPIMTEFQIYTLDANNCRISVCRDTKDFTNQQGRGKFQVSREKMLASLRPDGSLMLICEVEYLPPGTKISVEQEDDCDSCDEMANKIEFSLRESMRDMFVNELFSDCTIQVR